MAILLGMYRSFIVLIILFGSYVSGHSQPFDTLLSQFNFIEDIYPLQDSTFILIGASDEEILVERINHKAEVIWSTPVVSREKDYLRNIRFASNREDSLFQISTNDKDCDAYGFSLHKVFTIDFSGKLIDSQKVSFGDDNGYVFLLSGLPDQARLAYIIEKQPIVMMANGDTMQLHLTWPNGDTTETFILGEPKHISICPEGDILVRSSSNYVIRYKLIEGRYMVISARYGWGGVDEIICLDEDFFISVGSNSLTLYEDYYPSISFSMDDLEIWNTSWKDPWLIVQSFGFDHPDTFYFLDKFLNVQYKVEREIPSITNKAIQNEITYSVGSGNTYFDHGQLISEDQKSHLGPLHYDIEIVDFQIGPYSSVKWYYGFPNHYRYEIPLSSVTIKNKCEYPIENVTIQYRLQRTFCTDTFWERTLKKIDLQPGQTKSFDLFDIFIGQVHPPDKFEKVCIYAIRPDLHFDDAFENNEFCKHFDLVHSTEFSVDYSIQHTPSIIENTITFLGPQEIDFDLRIFTTTGIPVYSGQANTYSGSPLNLSFLPAGMYILQYKIHDTDIRYAEKILKY